MLHKRSAFFALLALVGLAVVQIVRHGQAAAGSTHARDPHRPPACAADPPQPAMPSPAAVVITFDYSGAEALLNALGADSLSDGDVDRLLQTRGVCAMVDNVTRYYPAVGAPEFREDIQRFARTKKPGSRDEYFRFRDVWRERARIRALIATIKSHEPHMRADAIAQLEPFRDDSVSLAVTARFVVGGVSSGFAMEDDLHSLYANLLDGDDDTNGIVLNMVHEAYHVLQTQSLARAGLNQRWMSQGSDIERLYAVTLAEGVAAYVADPTRWMTHGASMDRGRERYRRYADPKKIAANFARFDTVLQQLRDGKLTWEKMYADNFTASEGFYFIGYEMAKAIDQHCGRACLNRLFTEPPVEAFRRYIALYESGAAVTGRFSSGSASIIDTGR